MKIKIMFALIEFNFERLIKVYRLWAFNCWIKFSKYRLNLDTSCVYVGSHLIVLGESRSS